MNEIWFELAKAALSAFRAGAEVFATEARSVEERLSQEPRKAGESMRDRLRELTKDE